MKLMKAMKIPGFLVSCFTSGQVWGGGLGIDKIRSGLDKICRKSPLGVTIRKGSR